MEFIIARAIIIINSSSESSGGVIVIILSLIVSLLVPLPRCCVRTQFVVVVVNSSVGIATWAMANLIGHNELS